MKILIVEDDIKLAQNLTKVLTEAGYNVDHAGTGAAADYLLSTEVFDLLILDLGLPDGQGSDWLQRWRQAGIGIVTLILTARGTWADKASGFNAGADDYLVKPFAVAELLMRVKALIRRSYGQAHPHLTVGEVVFDTLTNQLSKQGMPVKLTAQETKLISYLMHASGRIVSRTELHDHVYDRDEEPDSNVIDVQVARLRKKLGRDFIETIRGQGYRVQAPAVD
ncbi:MULTISPECIES: response regulator transcription factor [Pseudidiomarina]|uniref:Winged helix family two component transcriptional regulator n=4 Tax=Pseudidiomarina TaxID=2800384 RepID=A0A368UMC1_9GAMM|nr:MULTISPECIES: response regulator transcription factor [Pseudidiomarina]MDT7526151.1 response regulator transcription factor [Pseudidiomarina sp. GXY010]PWW10340.1 winged helix family two component transcriptional regulator [Pseudidiomarina maritima]RBP87955.1 winged helix family two component transcriptional regulator [Pseudidiomarina tainanensis]RCW29926.1 winged helix family two component transcriptional regulator [Pseudidiomarina tainanensis]